MDILDKMKELINYGKPRQLMRLVEELKEDYILIEVKGVSLGKCWECPDEASAFLPIPVCAGCYSEIEG